MFKKDKKAYFLWCEVQIIKKNFLPLPAVLSRNVYPYTLFI